MSPTNVHDSLLRLRYVAGGRVHSLRPVATDSRRISLVIREHLPKQVNGDGSPGACGQLHHPLVASEAIWQRSGRQLLELVRQVAIGMDEPQDEASCDGQYSLALAVKVAVFALAMTGLTTLWMAIVADVGASLVVVLNGTRLCRI